MVSAGLALFLVSGGAGADQVSVGQAGGSISRTDCQALATNHTPAGVEYQPGVDVHGHAVAPADLPGGFTYNLPAKVEFDIVVNPINYGQRTLLQQQIAAAQAKLAQNPSDTASQQQLAQAQGQLAAISGRFDNTAMPVGHVSIDTKTGEATLNGQPLIGSQAQILTDLCRKSGY